MPQASPESVFHDLTRLHYAHVVGSALKLARSRNVAEDLAHDAFLRASQKFDQFTPGTNFRAWMQTLLYHAHVDRLRRSRRELSLLPVSPAVAEPPVAEPDLSAALEEQIARLPQKQREAMRLELLGVPREQIARRLGITRANVDLRLHRAKERLRRVLPVEINR